jgi:hypothetical protein
LKRKPHLQKILKQEVPRYPDLAGSASVGQSHQLVLFDSEDLEVETVILDDDITVDEFRELMKAIGLRRVKGKKKKSKSKN